MKIRVHILATRKNGDGLDVGWFYTEHQLWESLINHVAESDREALALLDSGDHGALVDWLSDRSDGRFIWANGVAEIDVSKAEEIL